MTVLFLGIYLRELKTYVHTHTKEKKKETLCINVQSSITYKSQNIELVQMSTNWRMDKQKGVYLYNGILLCNKREWRTDTDYNMD